MYYVTALCRHALWLRQGRVERFGPALDVVHAYEEHLAARDAARTGEARREVVAAAPERGPARLLAVRWLPDDAAVEGTPRAFAPGDPWGVAVEWQSDQAARRFHLAVAIDRADGVQVCTFATHQDGLPPLSGSARYRFALRLPELPIVKGEFALYVFLLDEEGLHVYDQAVFHGAFRVDLDSYRTGLVTLRHAWEAGRPDVDSPGVSAAAPV
jgi:lipopolysaccharide transport system ATP-binding protein